MFADHRLNYFNSLCDDLLPSLLQVCSEYVHNTRLSVTPLGHKRHSTYFSPAQRDYSLFRLPQKGDYTLWSSLMSHIFYAPLVTCAFTPSSSVLLGAHHFMLMKSTTCQSPPMKDTLPFYFSLRVTAVANYNHVIILPRLIQ